MGEPRAEACSTLDHPQHRQIRTGTASDPVDRAGNARGRGGERAVIDVHACGRAKDRQGVVLGVGVYSDDERMSMRDDGHSGAGPSYSRDSSPAATAGAEPGRSHFGADL
jgi:hypothetical protein